MHIVYVSFNVKPESIERFKKISAENAENSLNEPGVIAFDLLQQYEEPSKLAFYEVYHAPQDHLNHRETEHYKKWKSEVDGLLQEPYTAAKYHDIR